MDLLILNIAFNYYYNNLFILDIVRSIPAIHFAITSFALQDFLVLDNQHNQNYQAFQ